MKLPDGLTDELLEAMIKAARRAAEMPINPDRLVVAVTEDDMPVTLGDLMRLDPDRAQLWLRAELDRVESMAGLSGPENEE